MPIPLLLPEDLISPIRRSKLGLKTVLEPNEILIHPAVYTSDFAYTEKFIEEVRAQVPEMIRQDVSAIEEILGEKTGIRVAEDGVYHGVGDIKFARIPHRWGPKEKLIDIDIMAASIAILPWDHKELYIDKTPTCPEMKHPLPEEKVRVYMIRDDESALILHMWHMHNVNYQGPAFFHYLRAFAITFNNYGLTQLK